MHAATFITGLVVLLAARVHVVPLVGEAQQAANIPQEAFYPRLPFRPHEPHVPSTPSDTAYESWAMSKVRTSPLSRAGRRESTPGFATSPPSWSASAPAIEAAKQATGTITSLARPGGNLTGLSVMAPELVGKRHAQERSRMARTSGRTLISAG